MSKQENKPVYKALRSEPERVRRARTGSQTINLTVISGPDTGQTMQFDQSRVRIGRDADNDFVLKDRYVSNLHGEFRRVDDGFLYQDLQSRHGSLVLVDDVSVRLQGTGSLKPVRITAESEIQVGSTVLRVFVESKKSDTKISTTFARSEDFGTGGEDDRFIMATQTSVEALTRRFTGRDPRLEILFRLSGKLNTLTRLEEIIDLIVEATFEVFPAANLFSISLLDEGNLTPFMTRIRGKDRRSNSDFIVSQSILERVVETREAVLFVRDDFGSEISRSILEAKISASLCAPLVGQRSLLGVMQVDSRSRGMMFSQDDLELFSVFASNVAFAFERAQLTENIYKMFEGFVAASVSAIEARDPTTAGHSSRVAEYSLALAKSANTIEAGHFSDFHLSTSELTELRYAALLHDFGKVGVREAVLMKGARVSDQKMELIGHRFDQFKHLRWRELAEEAFATNSGRTFLDTHDRFCVELDTLYKELEVIREQRALSDDQIDLVKKLGQRHLTRLNGELQPFLTEEEVKHLTIRFGTLSEEEWENMRSHAAQSEAYLERIPWSEDLARIPCIAGAHHEKLDGSGYPRGLLSEDILPQVRILTIADIFDAVTAWDRPYRKAASVQQATSILREESNAGKLDSRFVDLFVDVVIPEIIKLIPSSG